MITRLFFTRPQRGAFTLRSYRLIISIQTFCTLLAGTLWVSGCRPVPDVQPFAEQTRILEEQYGIATRGVAAEVMQLDVRRGQELDRELSRRARLLTATRQYAEELTVLAQAARPGSSGADQLAGAVQSLANQFEQALPVPYVGIAQEILDVVENVRARQSLADAIETADPAIQDLALLFSEEMKPLRDFVRLSYVLARMEAKKERPEYAAVIDEHQTAVNTRAELSDMLYRMQMQLVDVNTVNDDLETKLSNIQTRMTLIDNWIKDIESRTIWEEHQEKMQSLHARYTAVLQIMSEIEVAMETWSASHRQLADVVRTGSQADVDLLAHHIANLNRLISEVRNE